MKPPKELYCVIFNKYLIKDKLVSDTYALGAPSVLGIPQKILIKENKIIVTFENNIEHVIFYTENCELFYRDIEEKDDGKNTSNRVTAKRGRPRKNKS